MKFRLFFILFFSGFFLDEGDVGDSSCCAPAFGRWIQLLGNSASCIKNKNDELPSGARV